MEYDSLLATALARTAARTPSSAAEPPTQQDEDEEKQKEHERADDEADQKLERVWNEARAVSGLFVVSRDVSCDVTHSLRLCCCWWCSSGWPHPGFPCRTEDRSSGRRCRLSTAGRHTCQTQSTADCSLHQCSRTWTKYMFTCKIHQTIMRGCTHPSSQWYSTRDPFVFEPMYSKNPLEIVGGSPQMHAKKFKHFSRQCYYFSNPLSELVNKIRWSRHIQAGEICSAMLALYKYSHIQCTCLTETILSNMVMLFCSLYPLKDTVK